MSTELKIYKQNKIKEYKKGYNVTLLRLKSNLVKNIKIIQRSNVKEKQLLINKLITKYNNYLKSLNSLLNSQIISIRNFTPQPIKITTNKKALLIGINYRGTENELNGCINDISCIQERISNNGFNDISILTDDTDNKPTKNTILNAFTNLLRDSENGDLLFFAYSGHGSYTNDKNGDETTGYDQLIIPLDRNSISDDELKSIICQNLKSGVTLFAMFDSCFSGSVLDLRYQFMDSLNYDNFTDNNKQLETKGSVFMISGCTDYQTSTDAFINNKANGAMTWALTETLKITPTCTWKELIKSMRDLLVSYGYDQIPQFSSGRFEDIDTQIFI